MLLMMMNIMRGYSDSNSACVDRGEGCVEWVSRYMGDCLCNTSDVVSFVVGLTSVFCWAVAEVPQIITNFREHATEGISLVFLMTWVLGDIFNLLGCYLEPSTLPTQFYTALLYTITTLILVGQVIYYQHYLKWRKGRMVRDVPAQPITVQEERKPTQQIETKPIPAAPQATSQPIAYASIRRAHEQLYYTSARSLARSRTPTAGSILAAGSRGSAGRGSNQSFLEDFHESHPIPISVSTSRSAPAPIINAGSSPSILRAVASVVMCVGGLNIGRDFMMKHHRHSTLLEASNIPRVFARRKLFQLSELQMEYLNNRALYQESEGSLGVWLGWVMAAIYMGGRLPQIWLNIKRGSVEGLNPLMFTFALLGNVTYVGSILIRSAKWENIESNMPWLVDAGVCVCLDFLILLQFIHYYTRKPKDAGEDSGGHYKSLE